MKEYIQVAFDESVVNHQLVKDKLIQTEGKLNLNEVTDIWVHYEHLYSLSKHAYDLIRDLEDIERGDKYRLQVLTAESDKKAKEQRATIRKLRISLKDCNAKLKQLNKGGLR